ncbi:2433_t:CDS:2 [Funneliformis geosporum]|uniref:6143_t:CDS:1 n=1 Tax=Funneliformis geosporum TaxID=1117311 RepID=A0A9W4WMZ3_9GLOM|nr:2433_t:CDS:2 [Funneliformis geosporum]CAI2173424.1 6143_t:CDS:2 [Funneliformis geosporum]
MSTNTETTTTATITTTTPVSQDPEFQVPEDTVLTTTQDAESQSPITRVIVIAIDHSTHSQQAFYWALKNFLRKENDLVVLVNVRSIPTVPGPYGKLPGPYAAIGASYMDFSEVVTSLEEQHRLNSHALLQEFASKLKAQNVPIAMKGDARDEIVRKVAELNADALVIGSRGLGALRRTLLGSVSDYCSHNCHCSVIIVKERVDQKDQKQ